MRRDSIDMLVSLRTPLGNHCMQIDHDVVKRVAANAETRPELWIEMLKIAEVTHMAEIGVYRGQLTRRLLKGCPAIQRYYMVDPWRHLSDWHKPANQTDEVFHEFLADTKVHTEFAHDKRIILRGTTAEVADQIADGELDFVYIDGDHTLKGITIDLIRLYPKVRAGGWIGGDDFRRSIWQHSTMYEPTLVFPFAVYFAEAVGARIYGLPHNQFLIQKQDPPGQFSFTDLVGRYSDVRLRQQFKPSRMLREWFKGWSRRTMRTSRNLVLGKHAS